MSSSDKAPLFIELEFEQSEGEIVMHLNKSPLGQRLHGRFELPFSSAELSAKLEAIECKRLSADELESFGQQLYQAMAQTHIGQAIRKALGLAYQHRGTQAILQLRFDEHAIDLLAIPWELLHDGRRYLVGNGIELTRYIDYSEALSPLVVTPPLRVLQVIASPTDLPDLNVHRTIEALDGVDNIVVERVSTYRAMRKELRKTRYHVLHFDGHGMVEDGKNVLYFQDKRGKSVAVNAAALQRALGNQVDLVVLNACQGSKITGTTGTSVFNSLAPALIAVGIPAVVGMQFSILDQSAAYFIEAFYEAVANLEPLTQAIAEARGELDLSNEWYIPTLYLRSSDPIGRLFAPTGQVVSPPEEVAVEPMPKKPVVANDESRQREVEVPVEAMPAPPVEAKTPAVEPVAPAVPLLFAEGKLKEWPYPIAVVCAKANQVVSEARFVALDGVLNHLVKYLTAIALSHYWQDKPDKKQLRLWLAKMSQGRLMTSLEVLNQISAHYMATQDADLLLAVLFEPYTRALRESSAIAEAYRAVRRLQPEQKAQAEEITCQSFLVQLLALRQTKWESNVTQADSTLQETLLQVLERAWPELIEHVQSLLHYRLRYVERVAQDGADWVASMVEFRGVNQEPSIVATPFREREVEQPSYRARRLYLCTSQGQPRLNLHPFLISHHYKLYFLEQAAEREEIWYQHCGSAERYQPESVWASLMPSWLKTEKEMDEADDPVNQLDQAGQELEKVENQQRWVQTPLPILLSIHLEESGRQALEIALGEALRIGRFWLGLEFLLMGLSKQKGTLFPQFLREMGIHPSKFRGILRGQVGIVSQEDWRQKDVSSLGTQALNQLLEPDAELLRQNFKNNRQPDPIITPRMRSILQEAAKLAGQSQVGHKHLLGAALRHTHSLAMQLFFLIMGEAGWSSGQVLKRLTELLGMTPEELLGDQVKRQSKQKPAIPQAPPRRRNGSILAQFGRNLTQAAKEGELHPVVGESARRAMTQMGRILLQREANNPILVGDPGVGKTAIVEGFAWRLAGQGKRVVQPLKNRRVVELPTNALLSGTKYRGDLEARLQRLLAEVKADGQVIVFIDELHSILGGRASGGLSAIADAIKPALARGEFPCIGATTVAEYRQHIEKDKALARRFTPVWVEEPTISEAVEIVNGVAINRLASHHGVQFVPAAIEAAVSLSARYLHDERLPGKAIKVLDQACAGQVMPGSLSGQSDEEPTLAGGLVDAQAVLEVIAKLTNIPLERLAKSDKQRLLELSATLKARIMGQDHAISRVTRVLKRAGAGLADPRRPMGVFLFAGPTGVGKTELALALTEALFDREDVIFRLDMSEFMEKHQVARLIGAPPGYIGYDQEGQLTGHLRRHPYSVVLLDEIEKAHKDVQHLFLQLFEDGRLTDAQGRLADGRSAIFVMTTNLGAKDALGLAPTGLKDQLKAAITKHFTPEFINRIDRIIYFNQLNQEALIAIFDREFASVQKRLNQQGYQLPEIPQAIKEQVAAKVQQQKLGARPLRRFIEDKIVAPLVDKLLQGDIQPGQEIPFDLNLSVDTDKASSPLRPAAPQPNPFQPGQSGLGGFGGLGLGPSKPIGPPKPKRPLSPQDGLPHLPDVDDEQQNPFDERFLALAKQLQTQGIALSITNFCKNFLCAPYNQVLRNDLAPEQAFEELIEEPLNDKLLAEEFKHGDWVQVDRKHQKIVFEKMV